MARCELLVQRVSSKGFPPEVQKQTSYSCLTRVPGNILRFML